MELDRIVENLESERKNEYEIKEKIEKCTKQLNKFRNKVDDLQVMIDLKCKVEVDKEVSSKNDIENEIQRLKIEVETVKIGCKDS